MRNTKLFQSVVGTGALLLALGTTGPHAGSEARPTHVDIFDSCHRHLVVWLPVPPSTRECGQVQTPQVKIFGGNGQLRFIGSALNAIDWAKAGQPLTPIPKFVTVRDALAEARILHLGVPLPGHGWVTYYGSTPCPPCEMQLVTFRSEVMPKLGVATTLSMLELGE